MSRQDQPLYQYARAYGVDTAYHNAMGEWVEATEAALLCVLQRLGAPIERADEAADALHQLRRARWQRAIEPVVTHWLTDGAQPSVLIQTPYGAQGTSYHLTLQPEDGDSIIAEGKLQTSMLEAQEDIDGETFARWRVPIPTAQPAKKSKRGRKQKAGSKRSASKQKTSQPASAAGLAMGYHQLQLSLASSQHSSLLLAAPERVYAPWRGDDERYWGAFLPLYALHREGSDAIGNLSDLQALMEWIDHAGGHVVGTLPLLAAFLDHPCEPSPYAPASRLLWNEIYLDLTQIEEWDQALAAPAPPSSFPADEVDHKGEMQRKRLALEEMAQRFYNGHGKHRHSFDKWCARHPHAEEYAAFRATHEQQAAPWQEWPEALRDDPEQDDTADAMRYHLYVQWQLHRQLHTLSSGQSDNSLGLYLDLPLGVHPHGFDTWRYPHAFCHGMATGAPPDALQIRGQNWGFPPLHPQQLREHRYDYLIATYRNHMQYAGVLRIDHVMGLYRLFAIPDGMDATDGVYIRFHQDEIYAILSIESHRQRCLLLGEDLGTVPDAVGEAMERHGVQRMHVVQFAMDDAPGHALHDPPATTIASLNTHDTPTYQGFWHGQDLDIGTELGLYPPTAMAQAFAGRDRLRKSVAAYLFQQGYLDTTSPDDQALTLATLSWLGRSDARIALMNLEDLWLETRPQNVPGTGNERPNWRKKARYSLEEIQRREDVSAALDAMAQARGSATKTSKPSLPGASATPQAHTSEPSRLPSLPRNMHPQRPVVSAQEGFLREEDLYLFNEGTHHRIYHKWGAHLVIQDGIPGVHFAVWAPGAEDVSVIGEWNDWTPQQDRLQPQGSSGVWTGFVPRVHRGQMYKYHIRRHGELHGRDKADPVGFLHQCPPETASHVWSLDYLWGDQRWMRQRHQHNGLDAPISLYELHLGSWLRPEGDPGGFLGFRKSARTLAAHVKDLGFTHVELMPVMEHPFYGSWGYQTTGYFAPTARYGTPQDLMYLIDVLHQHDIGVILDWVPSHFPMDAHGLAQFDGTHLYEHADPRQGYHPDWTSAIFNYGRHEVRSFLLSSAMFWFDKYHIDGLRVDAVASMLYLDYSREDGEWLPNAHGGRENLEAIHFLQSLNEAIYTHYPDTQSIAEESTAWPQVSRPTSMGGLGFGMKWDMGWMHDTLRYLRREPIHRQHHHDDLTFRSLYAFHENFVLALSHDEVVHGKGSLLSRMPGDDWQKRANLRAMLGYMYGQSGKKHLFMGVEMGMWREWSHDGELPWHLLDNPDHRGIYRWLQRLNRLMREEPALHTDDFQAEGFEWLDADDRSHSIYSFARRSSTPGSSSVIVVCNFTPVVREGYRLGVPQPGLWRELTNSDELAYGGSGVINQGDLQSQPIPAHSADHSIEITLPPLGVIFLKPSEPLHG